MLAATSYKINKQLYQNYKIIKKSYITHDENIICASGHDGLLYHNVHSTHLTIGSGLSQDKTKIN